MDGLDALVFETGCESHADAAKTIGLYDSTGKIPLHKELTNYLEKIVEDEIPLYFVDTENKAGLKSVLIGLGLNCFHEIVLPTTLFYYALSNSCDLSRFYENGNFISSLVLTALCAKVQDLRNSSNDSLKKLGRKFVSYFHFLTQNPIVEFRNAVVAEKIKKCVVPELLKNRAKSKDRPLRIGILYGALHVGIRECLKSNLRTKITLAFHKYYSRLIFDERSFDKVTEVNLSND